MSVLKQPIITEKSTQLVSSANQYAFEVELGANKIQIAKAVEEQYNVNVEGVQAQIRAGKKKRILGRREFGQRPSRKIAYVKLAEGQKIAEFEEKLEE